MVRKQRIRHKKPVEIDSISAAVADAQNASDPARETVMINTGLTFRFVKNRVSINRNESNYARRANKRACLIATVILIIQAVRMRSNGLAWQFQANRTRFVHFFG